MLTDKQSLILCGILAAGIFVSGILNILNNFVVLTIITIIFLTIVGNLVYILNHKKEKEDSTENEE